MLRSDVALPWNARKSFAGAADAVVRRGDRVLVRRQAHAVVRQLDRVQVVSGLERVRRLDPLVEVTSVDEVELRGGPIAGTALHVRDRLGEQRLDVGINLRLRVERGVVDFPKEDRLTIRDVAEDIGTQPDQHRLEHLGDAGVHAVALFLRDLLNGAQVDQPAAAVDLDEVGIGIDLGEEIPAPELHEPATHPAARLREQAREHPDVRFLHAELRRLRGDEQLVARRLTRVVGVLVAADPILREEIRTTRRAGEQEPTERDRTEVVSWMWSSRSAIQVDGEHEGARLRHVEVVHAARVLNRAA